jgi:hypothetical protein
MAAAIRKGYTRENVCYLIEHSNHTGTNSSRERDTEFIDVIPYLLPLNFSSLPSSKTNTEK